MLTKALVVTTGALLILVPRVVYAEMRPVTRPVTVDDFTQAQERRARQAVVLAGYTPSIVTAFQAGAFFIKATKNGQTYQVTVDSSGHTYFTAPSVE